MEDEISEKFHFGLSTEPKWIIAIVCPQFLQILDHLGKLLLNYLFFFFVVVVVYLLLLACYCF